MNGILALFLIFVIPIIVVLLITILLDIIERQTEKELKKRDIYAKHFLESKGE